MVCWKICMLLQCYTPEDDIITIECILNPQLIPSCYFEYVHHCHLLVDISVPFCELLWGMCSSESVLLEFLICNPVLFDDII